MSPIISPFIATSLCAQKNRHFIIQCKKKNSSFALILTVTHAYQTKLLCTET